MIATLIVFAFDAADDVEIPPIRDTRSATAATSSAAACHLRNLAFPIWGPPFRCRSIHSQRLDRSPQPPALPSDTPFSHPPPRAGTASGEPRRRMPQPAAAA